MYIEMYFIESYSISQLRGKNRARVKEWFTLLLHLRIRLHTHTRQTRPLPPLLGFHFRHVRPLPFPRFRLARPVRLHNKIPSRRHSRIRFVAPVCCCSRIHRSRIRHSRNRPPVVSVGSRIQVPFHSRSPHSRNRFVPAHSRSRRNKNPFFRFVVLDLTVPM